MVYTSKLVMGTGYIPLFTVNNELSVCSNADAANAANVVNW